MLMGRPSHNKQVRRDALREELQAREYLRQIQQVDNALSAEWRTMKRTQVEALRLKVDLNFRRLKKVLPDLKLVGDEKLEVMINNFNKPLEDKSERIPDKRPDGLFI